MANEKLGFITKEEWDKIKQVGAVKNTHGPILYAHRGLNSNNSTIGNSAAENSLAAFEAAGLAGFKALETDIIETTDGGFFCIHNDTTGSYSSTSRNVTTSTTANINSIVCNKIAKVQDVSSLDKIPTLDEYLAICNRYNMLAVVEFKLLQNNTTSVDNLITAIEKWTTNYVIISFDLNYCKRAKEFRKSARVSYLTPTGTTVTNSVIDTYAALDMGVAAPISKITSSVCDYAASLGYPVIIWTIDNPNQYYQTYRNWNVWTFGTNSILPEMEDRGAGCLKKAMTWKPKLTRTGTSWVNSFRESGWNPSGNRYISQFVNVIGCNRVLVEGDTSVVTFGTASGQVKFVICQFNALGKLIFDQGWFNENAPGVRNYIVNGKKYVDFKLLPDTCYVMLYFAEGTGNTTLSDDIINKLEQTITITATGTEYTSYYGEKM